jgi:hypothetical protein
MEDIFQDLQHWATENLIESKEGEEDEKEQLEQTQESDELLEKQVNSFWYIAYRVEEEGETKEIHMSHSVVTTRSASKKASSKNPTPSKPPKNDPHTQKTPDTPSKMIVPSNATTKSEYDFMEDLKITKANISLFDLMKLPQIQENFIKTLQGKITKTSKEINVGVKKGTSKYSPSDDTHTPKSQVVEDASLSGQRSRSITPSFLVTFEIFNRNVQNCMMDFGSSSNVMHFIVCEKLSVEPKQSEIQII